MSRMKKTAFAYEDEDEAELKMQSPSEYFQSLDISNLKEETVTAYAEKITQIGDLEFLHPSKALPLLAVCQKIIQWYLVNFEEKESEIGTLRQQVREFCDPDLAPKPTAVSHSSASENFGKIRDAASLTELNGHQSQQPSVQKDDTQKKSRRKKCLKRESNTNKRAENTKNSREGRKSRLLSNAKVHVGNNTRTSGFPLPSTSPRSTSSSSSHSANVAATNIQRKMRGHLERIRFRKHLNELISAGENNLLQYPLAPLAPLRRPRDSDSKQEVIL